MWDHDAVDQLIILRLKMSSPSKLRLLSSHYSALSSPLELLLNLPLAPLLLPPQLETLLLAIFPSSLKNHKLVKRLDFHDVLLFLL